MATPKEMSAIQTKPKFGGISALYFLFACCAAPKTSFYKVLLQTLNLKMFFPVASLKKGGRFYLCWVADSWPLCFATITHRQLWAQDIRKIW